MVNELSIREILFNYNDEEELVVKKNFDMNDWGVFFVRL